VVQNERFKKIRNIGIIVLLVIATYAGVFAAGYNMGTKRGYAGVTEQSDKVEAGIQRAGYYSKELVSGVNSIEKGLTDTKFQVDAAKKGIISSRKEAELISEVTDRITERASAIEGQSSRVIEGSSNINTGFSDIEGIISEMLLQD